MHDRALFEATNPGLAAYWQSTFPGELPEQPVLPDRFEDTSIGLGGAEPRTVVSGHKHVGARDDPSTIGESQRHLRDFSRVVAGEETVEGIVSTMLELHPDRDNPRVLWHSARRGQAAPAGVTLAATACVRTPRSMT